MVTLLSDNLVIEGLAYLDDKTINTSSGKGLVCLGNMFITTKFGGGNAPIAFMGTTDQNLTFAGVTNLIQGDLIVDKPSGILYGDFDGVTLNTTGQQLVLQNGILEMGTTGVLTIGAGTTVSVNEPISGVSGAMQKEGITDFKFPLYRDRYAPLEIQGGGGGSNFVETNYLSKKYINGATDLASSLYTISQKEHWTMTSNITSTNVTLYWSDAIFSEINDLSKLVVAGYNGTSWENLGGTASITGLNAGKVTATNVDLSKFEALTFGSIGTTPSTNPLGIGIGGNACNNATAMNPGDNIAFDFTSDNGFNGIDPCSGASKLINGYVAWATFTGNGQMLDIGYGVSGFSENEIVLEVFSGTCGTLALVGCANDIPGYSNENVAIPTTLGNTYYIRVVSLGSGTSTTGNLSISNVPLISISTTPTPTENIYRGDANIPVYITELSVSNEDAILDAVSFATSGNYGNTDIPNFKLYLSSNSLWDVSDVLIAQQTLLSGAGENLFFEPSTPIVLANGTTQYLILTTDVSNTATYSRTLQIQAVSNGSFYFESADITSIGYLPGGVKTITALTPNICKGATTFTVGQCNQSFDILDEYTTSAPLSACANAQNDAWAKFNSGTNTSLVVEYSNLSEDASIEIYTGVCGALTAVSGCVNNVSGLGTETYTLSATTNTTYYIRVSNVNSSLGLSGYLCIRTTSPTGDLCQTASTITVNNPTSSFNILNTFRNNEGSSSASCANIAYLDAWASFTANSASTTIQYTNTNHNAGMAIYEGSCGNLSELGCANSVVLGTENLQITTTPSQIYWVRILNVQNTSSLSGTLQIMDTPPSSPQGVTISNVQGTQLDVSWTAVVNADAYLIDVSEDPNFATFVGSYQDFSVTATNTPITGLTEGTVYYIRLRASSSGVNSAYSTPVEQITSPAAPLALDASNITQTTFTMNWDVVTAADGYRLQVSKDNFSTFVTGFSNRDVGNVTSFNISGLTANTAYQYRVKAYIKIGVKEYTSQNSNVIIANTLPSAPATPSITQVYNFTQTTFTIDWSNIASATTYLLDISTSASFNPGSFVSGYENLDVGNINTLDITGLNAGVTHYLRIRSSNTGGTSAHSATAQGITVPANPNALSATAIGTNTFTANWGATSGTTQYVLDVSEDANFGSFILQNATATFTQKIIAGLIAGQTYYYRLRASNANGTSDYSNIISVSLFTQSPDAPNTPSGLTALAASGTAIRLFWKDNATNETGFEVYRSDDNISFQLVASLGANSGGTSAGDNVVTHLDEGLSPNTTYYYKVRAIGQNNSASIFTQVKSGVTDSGVPIAPDDLDAFPLPATKVLLTWDDNSDNETGFNIYRSTELIPEAFVLVGTANANDTTFTDNNGLIANEQYFYVVTSVNTFGQSFPSDPASVVTVDVPESPTGLVVTNVTGSEISIAWQDNSSDETGFVVEIASIFSNGVYLFAGETSPDDNSFTLNEENAGLQPNQLYLIRVRATKNDGNSPYSNILSVVTSPNPNITPPNAPSNLKGESVTTIENSVRWRDNSDDEIIFRIERAFVTFDALTSEPLYGSFAEVGRVLSGFTDLSDYNNNLIAGQYYAYRVFAVNGGGESLASDTTITQAICNIINVITTDIEGNGTITCDTKEVLLQLNSNVSNAEYQWFKNDEALEDANLSSYIAAETGEYFCLVTSGDCQKSSAILSVIINPAFSVNVYASFDDSQLLLTDFEGASSYQWYHNYEAIPQANEDTYKMTKNGSYYLVITDDNCSATSNIFYLDDITSIDESFDISKLMTVSPNPTESKLQVKIEGDFMGTYQLNLVHISGKKYPLKTSMKQTFVSEEVYDIAHLPAGMYILEYRSGDYFGYKKVLKF
jgi:hypothetical protein